MSESETLDKNYISDHFVKAVNSCDENLFRNLLQFFLENYETEFNFAALEKFNAEFKSQNVEGIDNEMLVRQLKYIVNKSIYGRVNKKFKGELKELGFNLSKIDLISDLTKRYFERNLSKNEKSAKKESVYLKDFDIVTEMPVAFSSYKISENFEENDDIKKQNLYLNLRVKDGSHGERREILEMDKVKMIGIFEGIEKIQEELDKLS